ncbi:DUF3784 domain-containing protein [Halosolutus gelatinilyticus]|uniref:DUF3784 domain-containing protein n=1 Tax=Halosolutus gelatinilyticus TaxID=2931975 RepID=UPI001FF12F2C|nr:DUF3784 domain-containing protein [Halosolutus gelatinilyticus]
MSTGTIVSLLVAAGFVGLFGALIKYAGMVSLIAGYDPDAVTDEEGLADFIGTNTLYVAALLLAVAAVEYAEPIDASEGVWIAFVVGVGLLTVRMIRGTRRYETAR